jgi:hypothetical protein
MDKIYSAMDVLNVIAVVERLAVVNAELEYLMAHGSNDEKLVNVKRELENSVRKYKSIVSDNEEVVVEESEDLDLVALKLDFDSVVLRYKTRKRELQTIIKSYTNGNID